jgi:hypothetical protein
MQWKLLWIISVDFDAMNQPLMKYSALIKYLRKNWNKIRWCIKKAYDLIRKEVLYNILIEFNIPMKVVWLYKFV